MWPATPSLNPNRENKRKDAASRSFRYRRSCSIVANTGGYGTPFALPGVSTIETGYDVRGWFAYLTQFAMAVIMIEFVKSIRNAPTTGTTRNARGAGPYFSASSSITATALVVIPSM